MTPCDRHGRRDSEYVTQFHIRQGDRSASLAWDVRGGRAREVRVFRSAQGFAVEGVDPAGDDRQRLVYQGTDLDVRLADAGPASDLAYRYSNDIVYYYSVFARGDDGNWHLQLSETAAPRSVSHWLLSSRERDEGGLPKFAGTEIIRELETFMMPEP